MTRRWNLPLAVLAVASAFMAGGCGYSTASQYPDGIRTVFVPIWARGQDVYRRELEMRLTKAIIQRIEQTPYKITTKARADSELTGSLDRIEQDVLSWNPDTGMPNEKRVTLVVSFRWTDLRSGEVIVARKNFRVSRTYISACPVSEDFFQGSEDAINRLAGRIVEQMEKAW